MGKYVKKAQIEFERAWQEALRGITTDGVDEDAIDRMLKAADHLSEAVHRAA